MRIAFATTEFIKDNKPFDGGLANYLLKISKGLLNEGHEPVVFMVSDKYETVFFDGIEVVKCSKKINLLYRILDKLSRYKFQPILSAFWSSYFLNKAIRKYHRKKKIDIVQYANLNGLGFFRPGNIPSVIRASSYIPLWNEADEIKNKTLSQRQIEIFEDWVFRRVKNVFAPSHYIAGFLSKRFKKQVHVIETPLPDINAENFDFEKVKEIKERIGNKIFFLYFGSIGAWKGVGDLLVAIQLFFEKKNFAFVFVGNPKGNKGKEIFKELKWLELSFPERIVYLPALQHSQLFPIIDASWAVLLPSRVENFSNACIEAMSRKKIVLAADGSSFEQIIEDGWNSFLFKRMDANDLAEKLNDLVNLKSEERIKVEENALKALERLKVSGIVKQHLEYYKRAIKSQ
jgi:glycosyltransferase involved in cell wall biosynthesis